MNRRQFFGLTVGAIAGAVMPKPVSPPQLFAAEFFARGVDLTQFVSRGVLTINEVRAMLPNEQFRAEISGVWD